MKIVNLTILIVITLIIPSTFLFSGDGNTETLKETKERAFNAVKTNDIVLLTDLIKKKDILNSVDGWGWSLLHWAVFQKNTNLVRLLLQKGADCDLMTTQDYERRSDHVIFYRDSKALDFAVLNNSVEIAELLIQKIGEKTFDKSFIKLFIFTTIYYLPGMQDYLIEKCSDVNAKDENGWTPLHMLADSYANLDVVKHLLEKGADINSQSLKSVKQRYRNRHFPAGSTPVDMAEISGQRDLLILLLQNGGKRNKNRSEQFLFKPEIYGNDYEISISPNNSWWIIVAEGTIFHADNIKTHWNQFQPKLTQDSGKRRPFSKMALNCKRITFLTDDIAFISGGHLMFRTGDRGKTWQEIDYGSLSWIYDVFSNSKGEVWMGGSSGDIFYSKDFALTWQKRKTPFDQSSRMNTIFMADSKRGIAGALRNALYRTNDNWETFEKIPTPLDQKKFPPPGSPYIDYRFLEVTLWEDYIIVNQNKKIFYTLENNIQWKSFETELIAFAVCVQSNKFFAVTRNLEVIEYSDINTFKPLSSKKLTAPPMDMKTKNGSLYIMDKELNLYKINEIDFSRNQILIPMKNIPR